MDHEAELADAPTVPSSASTERLLATDKNTTLLARVFNLGRQPNPTHQSARLVNHITMAYGAWQAPAFGGTRVFFFVAYRDPAEFVVCFVYLCPLTGETGLKC